MINTRLQIGSKDYAIVTDIPILATFVQADVREPDKRSASSTKTIQFYGNNKINQLFENIFETNVVTNTFNVNHKIEAIYFVNELEVLRGDLQLKSVTRDTENNIIYEAVIIGRDGSLFLEIGDKLIVGNVDSLDDLDFSEYNHEYSRSKIINSYTHLCDVNGTPTTLANGEGYVYGMIHKGIDSTLPYQTPSVAGSELDYSYKSFLPQFFAREYLLKIFEKAGYTWDSTFLDSDEFKSIVIDSNVNKLLLTQSDLENNQFYVGINTDFDIDYTYPSAANAPIFNAQTGDFYDIGNIITGANTTAVIPINKTYEFRFKSRLKFSLNHSNPSVTQYIFRSTMQGRLSLNASPFLGFFVNVAFGSSGDLVTTNAINTIYNSEEFQNSGQFNCSVSDVISLNFTNAYNDIPLFYNASNVLVTGGTYTVNVALESDYTSFSGLVVDKNIYEGNLYSINSSLPQKIKQKDFLKSIMQRFNLFIEVDRVNPKLLKVEPYDDFFNGGIENWENKVDYDKEIVTNPASLIDSKKYIFRDKDDSDYYNKKYKETYFESFGTANVFIDNDFLKNDKVNETIFSPTPNVDSTILGVAIPKIQAIENNLIKPTAQNIRLLYYNGLKNCNAWNFNQGYPTVNTTVLNQYAEVSHLDDDYAPTLDLNFGLPKEVYYTYPNAFFTTNNCYNRFHKNYVENITSKDSKVIVCNLWLTPYDIYIFSFRKKYFISIFDSGSYYLINKIIDYNPYSQQSTKVELIKVLDKLTFTPTSFRLSTSDVYIGEVVPYKLNNSLTLGNSVNRGINTIAIGDGIYIPETARNVTIIGNNVRVADGISDVSLLNTNNVDVTASNETYVNGIISNPFTGSYSEAQTYLFTIAPFEVYLDNTKSTVFIDATNSLIDVYMPNPIDCFVNGISKVFNIKKIDNINNVVVMPFASETIDGAATFVISGQYDSITLQTNGINWFII